MTTEEKEKELNGKRYVLISESIEKQRAAGDEVSYELEIDLHWAWMETMKQAREEFGLSPKQEEPLKVVDYEDNPEYDHNITLTLSNGSKVHYNNLEFKRGDHLLKSDVMGLSPQDAEHIIKTKTIQH